MKSANRIKRKRGQTLTGLFLTSFLFSHLIISCHSQQQEQQQETHTQTPEALYRATVRQWRSKRSWDPWLKFSDTLLQRFETSNNDGDSDNNSSSSSTSLSSSQRLEIVGAIEEGILAIERATVARGAGEDAVRDATLSHMYTTYGSVLLQLSPDECHSLALDPHTLLIGAETVAAAAAAASNGNDDADADPSPSTHLCRENAENALRNGSTLDATNVHSQELLEEMFGDNAVHVRKPKEFVAELFDSFAETFDEMLLDNLEYKVPQMVGDLAKQLLSSSSSKSSSYNAVMDAGCGTGLAGRVLRPIISNGDGANGSGSGHGVMVGVDASQKMLDIAAACTLTSGCGLAKANASDGDDIVDMDANDSPSSPPLYDGLLAMDLEEMTIANTLHTISSSSSSNTSNTIPPAGYDLIVAADVLVYFGSITNLLSTFASISMKGEGATLVFSCERATEEEAPLGWRLLSSGRFAHTKKHALEAAADAGYELVYYEEIVPRIERGEDVKGHLFGFVLQNTSTSTSTSTSTRKENEGKEEL